jgi:serine/threonine-protein kinase RsbW
MDLLRASRPPVAVTELRAWTLDSFDQLRLLRASLHEAITGDVRPAGADVEDLLERVAVVATELATNALRHARPPTVVRLLAAAGLFVLDVADHHVDTPPGIDRGRAFGDGGLGLLFASRLSLDTGWYTTATTKHVWATFPA